jgi:hypothetical protein
MPPVALDVAHLEMRRAGDERVALPFARCELAV